MKKIYAAPVFEYESYELDEFVANCGNTTPNQSPTDCTITWGGVPVFDVEINGGCYMDESDFESDDNDGFCYHIPTDDIRFFGS